MKAPTRFRVRRAGAVATTLLCAAIFSTALSTASASAGISSPTPDNSGAIRSSLTEIARQRGVSLEKVTADTAVGDRLAAFGTDQRASFKGYLDFRFEPDGLSATWIVEDWAANTALAVVRTAKVPVTVRSSAKSAARQSEENARVAEILRANNGGANVLGVTYDWFTERYQIAIGPNNSADAMKVNVAAKTPALSSVLGVPFKGDVSVSSEGFYGGLRETRTDGIKCTSGFGVWTPVLAKGVYLTTGHCDWGTWLVNGQSGPAAWVETSTYVDRMTINANNASYLVRVSPTQVVDMQAVADHIFLNNWYCHFGKSSDEQSCGTVYAQNTPYNSAPGVITRASLSSARCKPGDSGGPVWAPGSLRPSGLIASGDTSVAPDSKGRWPCKYVALDDQLAGTGWSML